MKTHLADSIRPRPRHAALGFTLAEVLVSMALLGTLAAMMYPMLVNNVGEDRLLQCCKEAAAQISLAYTGYQSESSIEDTTTADEVLSVGLNNYVRRFPDPAMPSATGDNLSVQVADAAGTETTIACDADHPCYVLQSGSILQFDADAKWDGTAANVNALRFFVDPDGAGVQLATAFVLFANGRMTTEANAPSAVFVNDDRVTGIADPGYLVDWTGG